VENLYKQRDLLLSAYRTNPKKLGDWGFEVNDTSQKKKKPNGEGGEG